MHASSQKLFEGALHCSVDDTDSDSCIKAEMPLSGLNNNDKKVSKRQFS